MTDPIYKMKLHETLTPRDLPCEIFRVSGGWIYRFYTHQQNADGSPRYAFDSVFVSFDNEFMPVPVPSDNDFMREEKAK
jgi:hypothetical protein